MEDDCRPGRYLGPRSAIALPHHRPLAMHVMCFCTHRAALHALPRHSVGWSLTEESLCAPIRSSRVCRGGPAATWVHGPCGPVGDLCVWRGWHAKSRSMEEVGNGGWANTCLPEKCGYYLNYVLNFLFFNIQDFKGLSHIPRQRICIYITNQTSTAHKNT